MKTVSSREFFHHSKTVKSLKPGQELNGKPSFTIKKAGKRPHLTREQIERDWRRISKRKIKLDLVAGIRDVR